MIGDNTQPQRATCNTVIFATDDFGEEVLSYFIETCRPQIGQSKYDGFTVLINQAKTKLNHPVSNYGFVSLYHEGRGRTLLTGLIEALYNELLEYDSKESNIGGYRIIGVGEGLTHQMYSFLKQTKTITYLLNYAVNDKEPNPKEIEDQIDPSSLTDSIQNKLSLLMSNLKKSRDVNKPSYYFISLNESETSAQNEWSKFASTLPKDHKEFPFIGFSLTGDKGSYQLREDERKAEAALLLKVLTFEVGGHIRNRDSYTKEEIDRYFGIINNIDLVRHYSLKTVIDGARQAVIKGGLDSALKTAKLYLDFEPKAKVGDKDLVYPISDPIVEATKLWNNRDKIQYNKEELKLKEDEDNNQISFKQYFASREKIQAEVEELVSSTIRESALFGDPEQLIEDSWFKTVLMVVNAKVGQFVGKGEEESDLVIEDIIPRYNKKVGNLEQTNSIAKEKNNLHVRYKYLGGRLFQDALKKLHRELSEELAKSAGLKRFVEFQIDEDTNKKTQDDFENLDLHSINYFEKSFREFKSLAESGHRSIFSQKLLVSISILGLTLLISAFSENIDIPPNPPAWQVTAQGFGDYLSYYSDQVLYYVLILSYYILKKGSLISASILTLVIYALIHQSFAKRNQEKQIEYQSRLGRLRYAISRLVKESMPVKKTIAIFDNRCEQFVIGKAHNYQRSLDRYMTRVDNSLRCVKYLQKSLTTEQESVKELALKNSKSDSDWRLQPRIKNFEQSRVEFILSPPLVKRTNQENSSDDANISPWKTNGFQIDNVNASQDFFLYEEKFIRETQQDNYELQEQRPPDAEAKEISKDYKEILEHIRHSQKDVIEVIIQGKELNKKLSKIQSSLQGNQQKHLSANDPMLFIHLVRTKLIDEA